MSTYTRKQADSLWIDITCDNITDIDTTVGAWPTNWAGTWKISATLGSTALLSGTLTKATTPGLFQLRIGPVSGGSAWTSLAAGSYVLATEINNTSVDFRQEDQDTLVITTQGI